MAILSCFPYLPGLEVLIEVEEQAADEYAAAEESPMLGTLTRYIKVPTANAAIQVRVKVDTASFKERDGIAVVLKTRGRKIRRFISRGSRIKQSGLLISKFPRLIEGQYHEIGLTFSSFEVSDATLTRDEQPSAEFENMGIFTVEVYRVSNIRDNRSPKPVSADTLQNARVVPEQKIKGKAITHDISLDIGQRTEGPRRFHCNYGNRSGATFHFKYRTLAALKNLGIVPRTPSPDPLAIKNPDYMTDAEKTACIRAYQAERARMQAAIPNLKFEPKSENGTEEDGTPIVDISRPKPKAEVVDLTAD